jgi:hypothetical protein
LLLFAGALLLGATLLFAVQPMVGKMLLPRLGGAPAVWNTCMVFFQVCLLAGYAYSHFLPRWLGQRRHIVLHLILICLPLLLLPIALPASEPSPAAPLRWLLITLATSAALPIFAVSTSAPLLQRWYSISGRGEVREPYFLYAASNAGSIIGLLGYAFIIEPQLRVATQTRLWTAGYIAWLLLTAACAWRAWRASSNTLSESIAPAIATPAPPTARQRLRWLALAFVPSSYLLGVTTYISSDIAAVPLLWIIPLTLYLLSFVLTFASRPPIPHRFFVIALPFTMLVVVLLMLLMLSQPPAWALALHLLAFFIAAMVCHGELARTRPPPEHLTDFYLMISIGGALGGAFNALLAPILFPRPLEYPLAMVLACLLNARSPSTAIKKPRGTPLQRRVLDIVLPLLAGGLVALVLILNRAPADQPKPALVMLILLLVAVAMCITFVRRPLRFALAIAALWSVEMYVRPDTADVLATRRSFFGIHRVVSRPNADVIDLFHGTTLHGRQHIDDAGRPAQPTLALAYHYHTGPIGQLLRALPPERNNIAIVGLGVGALASYAQPGAHMTFYEIDPLVRWLAVDSNYFSFVSAAQSRGADVNTVLGDARLTLAKAPPASFDVVVIDAFSSDAIPVHLLTREAMAVYLSKLKPDGILAMHVSNIHLDLEPVAANLAANARCLALSCDDDEVPVAELAAGKAASLWMAIAPSPGALAPLRQQPGWVPSRRDASGAVWTDDFCNVVQALRWWKKRG